jgi:hypothetical protein
MLAPPMKTPTRTVQLLIFIALIGIQQAGFGHGSVTADEDLCIIKIGFYSAHFKIYQPRTREHTDYCEDLPDTGETVFVMEYTYGDLGGVPVDFRIIRDITNLGRFARISDVEALSQAEIEAATVIYRPPARQPDVYTISHPFEEAGNYLGIVTARHPETDQLYLAVFPFEVGYIGYGYVPYFILFAMFIQSIYWWMNRDKRRQPSQRLA